MFAFSLAAHCPGSKQASRGSSTGASVDYWCCVEQDGIDRRKSSGKIRVTLGRMIIPIYLIVVRFDIAERDR